MGNRSLIEINHDYSFAVDDPAFVAALGRYLRSATALAAADLERFGVRVVGMRHHSETFIIKADAEGFPPQYLRAEGREGAGR